MNISYISKINKMEDLKKFSIENPIHMKNYLWHYLAIYGNMKGFKLLEKIDFPFGLPDEEGNNPFHISIKLGHYKLLDYLIKKYPKYINNRNNEDKSIMHYLAENEKIFNKYIKKFKSKKIDFKYLMISRDIDDISPAMLIFRNTNYKTIKNLIKIEPTIVNYPKFYPSLFFILKNDKINEKNIIDLMKLLKKNNVNLNMRDYRGENIILYAIDKKYKNLLDFLMKNGVDSSYMTPIDTNQSFRLAYRKEINSDKNFEMSRMLWDSGNIDPNQIDKYGDNLAHYLLLWRKKTGFGSKYLEKKIFPKVKDWNFPNIDNNTPFHILFSLKDKNNIKEIIKKKKINLKIKNHKGEMVQDLMPDRMINYFEPIDNKEDLKMKTYKYAHYNTFKARFMDICLYILYLNTRYKNLFVPMEKNEFRMDDLTVDKKLIIQANDPYSKKNFPFAWFVIWENINSFFINSELTNLINSYKEDEKYDFGLIFVQANLKSGGLHATLLLIDIKNNTIERFDPYGDTSSIDKGVDQIFEEELTWNTGFKYLKPSDIMGVASYQTLSKETDPFNQKSGDFGGYCLAWCMWYVEHRLLNPKISPKILIEKTLSKLVNRKESLMEYIRNYANKLNKHREKIMKDIGIPSKIISNEILPDKYSIKLYLHIFDSLKK
jgi:ankyrin repeat protein